MDLAARGQDTRLMQGTKDQSSHSAIPSSCWAICEEGLAMTGWRESGLTGDSAPLTPLHQDDRFPCDTRAGEISSLHCSEMMTSPPVYSQ